MCVIEDDLFVFVDGRVVGSPGIGSFLSYITLDFWLLTVLVLEKIRHRKLCVEHAL